MNVPRLVGRDKPRRLIPDKLKRVWLLLPLLAALLPACAGSEQAQTRLTPAEKIAFDLTLLDDDGLYGPPDGRRALHYQFCIPAVTAYAHEVKNIDPSVVIYPQSTGSRACSGAEYLCMGNTHQPNFREILAKLAALHYVGRIVRSDFE